LPVSGQSRVSTTARAHELLDDAAAFQQQGLFLPASFDLTFNLARSAQLGRLESHRARSVSCTITASPVAFPFPEGTLTA
jgi:hypothetical protein